VRHDAILEGLVSEVTVTTHRADDGPVPPDGGTESLDEQARRKGVRPIRSADDLVDSLVGHVAGTRSYVLRSASTNLKTGDRLLKLVLFVNLRWHDLGQVFINIDIK